MRGTAMERLRPAKNGKVFWQAGLVGQWTALEYLYPLLYAMVIYCPLPVTLIVPYLSQRYKSLWPGVMIHGLGNMLLLVLMIPSAVM
jgi:hypothetical protein